MFVLHVGIKLKAGQDDAVADVYRGPFKTAISAQEGFEWVQLLRPNDGGEYVLSIAFASQPLQQKWVATELHNKVWAQMESSFDSYSLKTYSTV